MQNYFTLFGLEPSFPLNEATLYKAYIALQQQTHPDRMVGKSDAERGKAALLSMEANEAYETLKSQLLRAQHLLSLHGVQVNSEGRDTIKPAQTLLMEMMELREELSEAADAHALSHAAQSIKTAMTDCTNKLTAAFEAQNWDDAGQLTIRLRYLGKALEEAYMRQHQHKAMS